MAEIIFLSNLNLFQNQLLQLVLENLPTPPPSPKAGRLYWDTALKQARVWDGTKWCNFIYTHPNHTGDVTSTGDGATVIQANVVTNTKLAKMPAKTLKGNAGGAVADPADLTVAQVSAMLANIDATLGGATPSDSILSSQKAVKTYIDTLINAVNQTVAGALVFVGGYNASTNTPNLDVTPTITGIKKGHTYVITAAGAFFTEEMEIGDMIISQQDNPTILEHWTRINRNIPPFVDATEFEKGIIQIATQAEVNAGVNDTKAVTPKKLKTYVEANADKYEKWNLKAGSDVPLQIHNHASSNTYKGVNITGGDNVNVWPGSGADGYATVTIEVPNSALSNSVSQVIGGAATFTINHTFATANIAVTIRRNSDGAIIYTEVIASTTNVKVNFNEPVAANYATVTLTNLR